MSKRIKVNVGTLDGMGQRFVSAWHRLERGEKVRERHLTFPTLAAMLNALSPKRLELLQAVHGAACEISEGACRTPRSGLQTRS